MEGLCQFCIQHVYCIISHSIGSLCISVSHFGNSQQYLKLFHYYIYDGNLYSVFFDITIVITFLFCIFKLRYEHCLFFLKT